MTRDRERAEKGGTQDKIGGAIENIKGRIEEATSSLGGGEESGRGGDGLRKVQESYGGYKVYDRHQQEIGKVDELFVDEDDRPEYIGVKTGLLGTKLTLIPMEIAEINDRRQAIEVSADRDAINDAPSFEEELTAEHEDRIYRHFGLERTGSAGERGGYGEYYPSDTSGGRSPGYREADEVSREGENSRSFGEGEASGGSPEEDERPETFAESSEEFREDPERPPRSVEGESSAVERRHGERAGTQDTPRGRPEVESETREAGEYRKHETRDLSDTTGEDAAHGITSVSGDEKDRHSSQSTEHELDARSSDLDLETSGSRHGQDRRGPDGEGRTDMRGSAATPKGDGVREGSADDYSDAGGGSSSVEGENEGETASRRSEGEPASGFGGQDPGSVRVRKRVQTDQKQIKVPVNREEARLERGPDGELRIRKEVVEDEETVEVDVQREHADIDDGGDLQR